MQNPPQRLEESKIEISIVSTQLNSNEQHGSARLSWRQLGSNSDRMAQLSQNYLALARSNVK